MMHDTQRESDVDEALLKQQREIDKINAMTHEELARKWRYAPLGDDYFNEDLPYYEVFRARLYDHFGGFTPEISKAIGGER